MSEPSSLDPGAQRTSDSLEKRRREAVQEIAQRNKEAHIRARKQREESDRIRAANRGPNPR